MKESFYRALFNDMHPGFFERPQIRAMPEEEVFDEMLLDLSTFDVNRYHKDLPKSISFGYYEGNLEMLRDKVVLVDDGWARYFYAGSRIYCGFVEGEVASFCIIAYQI
ncbi:MAG: hypothetical protein IJ647_07845 [Prevotella sp.]|nr:hypothetical protein [Prevotella sp.]